MKVVNRMKEVLTPRQYEIAEQITRGYAEKEIADKLHLSYETIHTHARNIRQVINARCNVDIAREFILSLENPKEYFTSIICSIIILISMGVNAQIDLRNAKTTTTPIRIVRLRARTKMPIKYS